MKTLICVEPGKLEYNQVADPEPAAGRAIIKVKRIGVCGTDLHAFEGTQPYFTYPRILGHELSGELVSVSDAPGFQTGETVSFIPYFSCSRCIACRSGKFNCCVNMKVAGVHINGGMSEYFSVPSYSLLHNNGLGGEDLAMVEPLAIASHGVRRAAVQQGEFVLVMGAGPIGLGTMELARLQGGNVIAMDVNEQRLEFCRNHLNISYTINALSSDVKQQLEQITNNEMPTIVIDATGNLSAIEKGFLYMAHGARYVLIGLQREEISFNHPEFHKREGTLMSSRNATREDFESVIKALKNNQIKPANYITHRVNFDKAGDEFVNWLNPASGVIKAMIEF